MKSAIVLFIIFFSIVAAFFISKWLQRITKPRQAFRRLLLYLLSVLILVFILSFLMVLVITKLYPSELIK